MRVSCSGILVVRDDAKGYREINKPDDHVALQSDLDRMNEWSQIWQLPFNETKCKCTHFGSHKFTYATNNQFLESTHEEKDSRCHRR